MSMHRSSLSPTYYDPEAEPVPEPEPEPEPVVEPPKRKGRPPGTKNKPKATKRSIPWFNVWRAVVWAVVASVSLVALFRGIDGWLGSSAACVVLAASLPIVAYLLDRDWKKMRK
jgi:hypothetical protein